MRRVCVARSNSTEPTPDISFRCLVIIAPWRDGRSSARRGCAASCDWGRTRGSAVTPRAGSLPVRQFEAERLLDKLSHLAAARLRGHEARARERIANGLREAFVRRFENTHAARLDPAECIDD